MSDEVKLLPCEGVIVQLLRQKLDLSDGLLDDLEESGNLQEVARAMLIEATRPPVVTDEVVERDTPFPMLDGPAIPRWLAEIVFQAYGTSGQSLDRIAERGGFGWKEVAYLFSELKRRKPSRHAELLAAALASMPAVVSGKL